MSKAKKSAFAEQQRQAAESAKARTLVPLGENAPMPKSVKKTARKTSRGK